MVTKPKAILFDMDDTIVAWDMVSDRSWRRTCEIFAPQVGIPDADTLYSVINRYREWYLSNMDRHLFARLNLPAYRREIVTLALEYLGLEANGHVERIADSYGTEREASAYLLPGAMDTLKYFKESGTKLALVSNGMSDGQWRKVKRFNMEPLFDCILIEGDFGTGKPDNRVFRHVLDKLNVKAADAWMVGDNLHFDISGGQAAGLYSIWVDWQDIGLSPTSPVNPDRIVRSIAELRDSVK